MSEVCKYCYGTHPSNNGCGVGSGRKDDLGKPRFSLVPWTAMESVVKVLEFGAKKYGDGNWKGVQGGYHRYVDAAQRHLVEVLKGNQIDPDSGLPHLAHVATNALFALWFTQKE